MEISLAHPGPSESASVELAITNKADRAALDDCPQQAVTGGELDHDSIEDAKECGREHGRQKRHRTRQGAAERRADDDDEHDIRGGAAAESPPGKEAIEQDCPEEYDGRPYAHLPPGDGLGFFPGQMLETLQHSCRRLCLLAGMEARQ